jgi:hypothetical protein
MAERQKCPVADPHRGRAAFAEHLPRVLLGRTLEQLGWVSPNALTLLVPMCAGPSGADDFLLRLGFQYYPEWPPTARFVNPDTREYDPARDLYWLPTVIGDPGFAVHPHYVHANYAGPLLCCSYIAEFYLILHDVQAAHLWNSDRHTFGATISRVQEALRSEYYKGRHVTERPKV